VGGVLEINNIDGYNCELSILDGSVVEGDEKNFTVNVPQYLFTFHTHPKLCYSHYNCFIGWPSNTDFNLSFILAFLPQNVKGTVSDIEWKNIVSLVFTPDYNYSVIINKYTKGMINVIASSNKYSKFIDFNISNDIFGYIKTKQDSIIKLFSVLDTNETIKLKIKIDTINYCIFILTIGKLISQELEYLNSLRIESINNKTKNIKEKEDSKNEFINKINNFSLFNIYEKLEKYSKDTFYNSLEEYKITFNIFNKYINNDKEKINLLLHPIFDIRIFNSNFGSTFKINTDIQLEKVNIQKSYNKKDSLKDRYVKDIPFIDTEYKFIL